LHLESQHNYHLRNAQSDRNPASNDDNETHLRHDSTAPTTYIFEVALCSSAAKV
jgi:hypothetical protein